MRVLLTGGGTGGHVNPALAIADAIKLHNKDAEIAYVGTKNGIENKLVEKEGYKMYHVEARGFQRSLSPKNLIAAWYYLTSPAAAKKVIREFRPDIVIGTGGYVCYAPLKAASELGIPTAVHESNALPGKAVRMLQDKVDLILLNFPQSEKYIDAKEKIRVVGNPLRGDFGAYTKAQARKLLGIDDEYKHVLLSYGGSLGAPAINSAALEIMEGYTASHPEVLHIHATGRKRYAEFSENFSARGLEKVKNISANEYIYDMPLKMAAADLVISRAGAMTVTEMAKMKKACIMIPSPYVADNHQYKNAKVLADVGAVELLEEKELSGKKIVELTKELLNDASRRHEMENKIADFAGENAGEIIYKEIEKLLK